MPLLLMFDKRRRVKAAEDPAPGFIAKDDFNRPDNASSPGVAVKGGAWVTSGIVFGLFSSRMYGSGAAPLTGMAILGAAADGVLTFTIFAQDYARYLHCPSFRITDINNALYVQPSGTALALNNITAGVVTTLASVPATFSNSSSYVMSVIFEGNGVRISQAGVNKLNFVLSGAGLAQTGILAGDRLLILGGAGSTSTNWLDDYSLIAATQFADFVVLDSVTRANSAASFGSATEKGGAWIALQGAGGVNAGTLYATVADTRAKLGTMVGGNGSVQCDMISDDWTLNTIGQLLRMTDKDNHLTAVVTGPVNASLRYRAAGVLTAYASWTDDLTNGVGATFVSRVVGASFTHTVNGVQKASFVMAGAPLLQTGQDCGVWFVVASVLTNIKNYLITT